MDQEKASVTEMGLTRTGRRAGCSCCSFTMLGFLALPIMAVVAFFVVL